MLNFGCFCLNQNHKLFISMSFINGVGLICVSSTTFITNVKWLMIYISTYLRFIQLLFHPPFLSIHLLAWVFYTLLPFKWSKREDKGMFHEMITFLNEHVPLSITFIASSNVLLNHLPLLFTTYILLTLDALFLLSMMKDKGAHSLCLMLAKPLYHLWNTLIFITCSIPFNPKL